MTGPQDIPFIVVYMIPSSGFNTDKKDNKICLIYKEIRMGSGKKVIYEEGLSNI
jgi:hypothetical protein